MAVICKFYIYVTTFLVCGISVAATVQKKSVVGTRMAETVGVYHWDGVAARGMSEGVNRAARMGFQNARVVLSPRYYSDYHTGTRPCYPGYSLSKMLAMSDIRKALVHANMRTIMITAYDGVTWGDCGTKMYMVPGFFTREHTLAVEKEYSDFVFALLHLKGSRGKRFILSNWESDNDVYCGSAYLYTEDKAFRERCVTNYPDWYGGNWSSTDSLFGLRLWFGARGRGIAHGRQRAQDEGLTNSEVFHAPEFDSVRALHDHGFQSVLRDAIPLLAVEYVSYSSHESNAKENPARSLSDDLDVICRLLGTRKIIIGEAGFQRSSWKETVVPRTDTVLHVALQWGVSYFFQWNLYDQDAKENLGLYDLKGRITLLGRYYKKVLKK